MKIKADFVTNSSSATFYLYLEMDKKYTMDEFLELIGEYMERYQRAHTYREDNILPFDPTVEHVGGRVFRLGDHVSMFNDFTNVPLYMTNLIFEFLSIKPARKTSSPRTPIPGLKDISFEVIEYG